MNFRTLDLNLLRVFDEVMAERNLTRAAKNLAITQPAISNALKRLRDHVGDELLVRAAAGVEPTPMAEKLWPVVREALGALHSAMVPDRFDASTATASFQLAMADATAALLIPPLIRRIEAQAAGISLRVLPLTTRDPRGLLAATDLDLAVGYFPIALAAITLDHMQRSDGGTARHERLYDGEYVCVMRRGHPLASRKMTLDAYCEAHHLLVSFSGRPYGFVDEALAAVHRTRRVVLTVNQFFTAGRVVSQSDLLTVLPKHFLFANGMQEDFAIRPLPFKVDTVHVDMLWHRRQHTRPAHEWLRAAVIEAAQAGFSEARRLTATISPRS